MEFYEGKINWDKDNQESINIVILFPFLISVPSQ